MKVANAIYYLLLACSFYACGQIGDHSHKDVPRMNINIIENNTVRQALEAWQAGDSRLWLSFFADDAKLYDDGSLRDFYSFSTETIGHERFFSIDKVEDNGTNVYGQFHSDLWGDFKTYFRFHFDRDGKIIRLDIGRADY
jgi:hypothetical protein